MQRSALLHEATGSSFSIAALSPRQRLESNKEWPNGCHEVNGVWKGQSQVCSFDSEGEGRDVSEYIRLFEKTKDEAALKEAFDCFDLNSDNWPTYKELKTIIKALGESGEGVEIVFEFDANNDGFFNLKCSANS
jgi:hypothetical protein